MIMLKIIVVVAAGLLLTACNAPETPPPPDPYVGRSVLDLAVRFGPPTVQFEVGNNQRAFIWTHFQQSGIAAIPAVNRCRLWALLIVCTSRAGPRQLDYRSLADITLLKRRMAMEAGGRNAPRTIWYRTRYPARSRGLREPDMLTKPGTEPAYVFKIAKLPATGTSNGLPMTGVLRWRSFRSEGTRTGDHVRGAMLRQLRTSPL